MICLTFLSVSGIFFSYRQNISTNLESIDGSDVIFVCVQYFLYPDTYYSRYYHIVYLFVITCWTWKNITICMTKVPWQETQVQYPGAPILFKLVGWNTKVIQLHGGSEVRLKEWVSCLLTWSLLLFDQWKVINWYWVQPFTIISIDKVR